MTKSKITDGVKEHVLVVDDEKDMCALIGHILGEADITSVAANTINEAKGILDSKRVSMAIIDWGLRGGGDTSGSELLCYCKKKFPLMPIVIISGLPFDWQTDAILKEADERIEKTNLNAARVVSTVNRLLKRNSLAPEIFFPQTPDQILTIEKIKKIYIKHVVNLLKGNISEAAIKLGIHRQTVAAAMEAKS